MPDSPPTDSPSPSSPAPSSPGHSQHWAASIASHLTGAVVSLSITLPIAKALPGLIAAQAWTQVMVALSCLAVAAAPASALPLVGRLLERVLPGGKP